MRLGERLLALHRSLDAGGIPHAFGGAIALGYATREPRATVDIDINVFLSAAEAERALRALPAGIARPADALARITLDEQIRLWWDQTPVDLFFDYAPIHAEAARNRQIVPFEGTEIPILGPTELAVFKAMFDRSRDWLDLEEMAAAGTLDAAAVRDGLLEMVDPGDERLRRLDEAARRGIG
jgi:hypothetical protein